MSRNPLVLAVRSQVDTPEFKAWFHDSLAVDSGGKPQVFYHGTASTAILKFKSWRGVAGHFSFDPKFASDYAEEAHGDAIADGYSIEQGAGAVVYVVYLKAANIFDLRLKEHRLKVGIEKEIGSYEDIELNLEAIKMAGYDSYFDFEYDSSFPPSGIAVFCPAQIKSATGNKGEYGPKNPNICMSRVLQERTR